MRHIYICTGPVCYARSSSRLLLQARLTRTPCHWSTQKPCIVVVTIYIFDSIFFIGAVLPCIQCLAKDCLPRTRQSTARTVRVWTINHRHLHCRSKWRSTLSCLCVVLSLYVEAAIAYSRRCDETSQTLPLTTSIVQATLFAWGIHFYRISCSLGLLVESRSIGMSKVDRQSNHEPLVVTLSIKSRSRSAQFLRDFGSPLRIQSPAVVP